MTEWRARVLTRLVRRPLRAAALQAALICIAFSAPAFATPKLQTWAAKNGARVIFVETHELPMVDVRVVLDAGSTRDPIGKQGLSTLIVSLLDEGAGGMHANDIAYEFERLGASYDAGSSYDLTSVSLRSLSESDKLAPALVNLKRVIAKPDFPADAIERQRRRMLVGIQQKEQSPGALADDAISAAIYGEHAYARPTSGTLETVGAITADDIKAFHKQYYVAANALIAIVGDVSTRQARKIADDLAGSLPRGEMPAPLAPIKLLESAEEVRIHHPSGQMHVLVGQTGMKYNDPDYFPLYVGNHVLGGGALVSRLFEQIREQRGLSYSASSAFAPRRVEGPFIAELQTRADQADEALAVLRDELDKFINDGPTDDELRAAKQNITGGFPLRIDSNSEIVNYAVVIGFYGLPLDYLDAFNAKVEAVTADNIRDAFQRRVHTDRMATVLVGPSPEKQEN